MSLMTADPPLPFTPAAHAVEVGPAAGLIEDAEGGRVFIYGVLAYAWDPGDEALRRVAAVQLVKLAAARPGQVAAGFGVDTATLFRWRQQVGDHGAGALVPGKRGPKGPSRLTDEVITQIQDQRSQGASLRQIGADLGLSASTVRVGLQQTAQADGDCGAEDHPENAYVADADEHPLSAAGEDSVAAADQPPLELLAAPSRRAGERALARAGLLGEAAPVFTPAARAPLAGLLLGLPGVAASGLLDCAAKVYGGLPQGFYGLKTVLLEAVFRTLAGEPRAEGATRIDPVALGRVLGMDRAPEVKTIRRKLAQLSAVGKATQLQEAIAGHHIESIDDADQTGLLFYVDGHIRAYQGTKKVGKTHLARLRLPAPATAETWISDADGDPVMVIMSQPGASLASELRRLLPDLRTAVGDERRVLVGFDRGGWSPALFAHMYAEGFDVLTWRKAPVEERPSKDFSQHCFQDEVGRSHTWDLAETTAQLKINKDGDTFTMRQVTRRDDQGKQAHILTTREDLSPGEIVYRMGSRWRQENYFRYGRLHLDLDSHDSYAATADDPARMVPNPAKREAHRTKQNAAAREEREQAQANAALLAVRTPASGESEVLITSQDHNQITEKWRAAAEDQHTAAIEHALTPARVPLAELAPDQQVLDTETKLITHAIKMSAFNTITSIARAIRVHTDYARAEDEAYTLARQVLTHTGDIDPRNDGELIIRLDPLPTPRATAAVAQLCEHLTATETIYPGTDLRLRYQIKNQP